MKDKMNFSLLSAYRQELMGVSILLILLYHIFIPLPVSNTIKFFTEQGRIGVDIFLILSGIGLYFSLKDNSSLLFFYKKRFIRILPTYFLLASPYFLYKTYTKHTNFFSEISFFTAIRGGDNPYYFIELILLCYLLMPFIYRMVEKDYIIPIFLLCIGCYFLGNISGYNEIVINRIPVFIIGVVIAKYVYNKYTIPHFIFFCSFLLILSCLVFFFPFSSNMTITRIKYSILALCFLTIAVTILSSLKENRIKKELRFLGGITLEIYMINFPIIAILVRLFNSTWGIAILAFILSIFFSFVSHKFINKILNISRLL